MIAIVTDSTASFIRKEAEDMGVFYVPMNYTVQGNSYLETYLDECGDYVSLLRGKNDLRTSQAIAASFYKTFSMLLEEDYDILCLTISSRLSGTHNNALTSARELSGERIRVIDSGTAAGGLHLLAKEARSLANQGLSLYEVHRETERLSKNVHIRFCVDDMAPLRRSGRLGVVRQSVGTILNVKPLLCCEDGRIFAQKQVRGNKEKRRELLSSVPEDAKGAAVIYFGIDEERRLLEASLKEKLGGNVRSLPIGPSVGIHVGEGTIGVAWIDR